MPAWTISSGVARGQPPPGAEVGARKSGIGLVKINKKQTATTFFCSSGQGEGASQSERMPKDKR